MLAIQNADILTCSEAGRIRNGRIVIDRGKIVSVGPDIGLLAAGCGSVDAKGMIVTPGFIDAHTHLGMSWQDWGTEPDMNENTSPYNPQIRAIDALNPRDISFDGAISTGVTAVMVQPGDVSVLASTPISPIAGQSAIIKTYVKHNRITILRQPAALKAGFGDLAKSGPQDPRRGPSSRMGVMALLRKHFYEAREYAKMGEDRARDLKLEPLAMVLEHKIPLTVHVQQSRDITAALRLANEFGIRLVFIHATLANQVIDDVAESGFPCVVGPVNLARGSWSQADPRLAHLLAERGITVAITSDHPTLPIQFLPALAGRAVRYGMSDDEALRAITINPAKIIGVADRLGSIEPGKDADVVIHDGDPLENTTRLRMVITDGEIVFDSEHAPKWEEHRP